MMLMMTAVGFVPKQPELVRFPSGSQKVSFEVCHKRSVNEGGQWIEVIEAAEFFCWGPEAEKLAEKLRPGLSVTAIGYQETSKWSGNDGAPRSKKLFKLVDIRVDRSSRPAQSQANEQSAAPSAAPRAPRSDRGYQQSAAPRHQAPERQAPAPHQAPSNARNAGHDDARYDDDGLMYY